MAKQSTPTSTLTVHVNNQHEFISLSLTDTTAKGKDKLTLTYSYRGDRVSATSDQPNPEFKQLVRDAGRKWSQARTNIPKDKTLGQLVTDFETKAKTCKTLAEFVAKM